MYHKRHLSMYTYIYEDTYTNAYKHAYKYRNRCAYTYTYE